MDARMRFNALAEARRSDSRERDRWLGKYLRIRRLYPAPWRNERAKYEGLIYVGVVSRSHSVSAGNVVPFVKRVRLSNVPLKSSPHRSRITNFIRHSSRNGARRTRPRSAIYLRRVATRYRFSRCVTKRFGSSFTVTPSPAESQRSEGRRIAAAVAVATTRLNSFSRLDPISRSSGSPVMDHRKSHMFPSGSRSPDRVDARAISIRALKHDARRGATTIDLQANGVGFTTRHERPDEYGVVKKRRRIDVSSSIMRREPGRCSALSDWIKNPGDKKKRRLRQRTNDPRSCFCSRVIVPA